MRPKRRTRGGDAAAGDGAAIGGREYALGAGIEGLVQRMAVAGNRAALVAMGPSDGARGRREGLAGQNSRQNVFDQPAA